MRREAAAAGTASSASSSSHQNGPSTSSMFHSSPQQQHAHHHQSRERVIIPREGRSLASMTRLQALRVSNRNRPLRLALAVAWACLCLALYASTVFGTVKEEGPAYARLASVSVDDSRLGGKEEGANALLDDRGADTNGGGANMHEEDVTAEGRALDGSPVEDISDMDGSEGEGGSHADEASPRDDGESNANLRGASNRETPGVAFSGDSPPDSNADVDEKDGGDLEFVARTANDTAANMTDIAGIVAGFGAGAGMGRHHRTRRSAADRQRDREALASASTKGFLAFGFWLLICVVIRLSVSFFVHGSAAGGGGESGGRGRIVFGRRGVSSSEARATRRQQQRARFDALVRRLNRARAEHGEGPISAESLRVVVSSRNFTGDDYDDLLRFDEESGMASASMLSSLGATRAEIDRCPSHVIQSENDCLMARGVATSSGGEPSASAAGGGRSCPVCLERYRLGDHVRTIPCFHTFHVDCIDPWLGQKAICPVCKHPAIG